MKKIISDLPEIIARKNRSHSILFEPCTTAWNAWSAKEIVEKVQKLIPFVLLAENPS